MERIRRERGDSATMAGRLRVEQSRQLRGGVEGDAGSKTTAPPTAETGRHQQQEGGVDAGEEISLTAARLYQRRAATPSAWRSDGNPTKLRRKRAKSGATRPHTIAATTTTPDQLMSSAAADAMGPHRGSAQQRQRKWQRPRQRQRQPSQQLQWPQQCQRTRRWPRRWHWPRRRQRQPRQRPTPYTYPAAKATASTTPPRGGDSGADNDGHRRAATAAARPDGRGDNDATPYRRCCHRARPVNDGASVQRRVWQHARPTRPTADAHRCGATRMARDAIGYSVRHPLMLAR